MKNSAINWTDNTFNPWEGCTRVSDGCKNCYAQANDKRHLREKVIHWGKGAPRRKMTDAYWDQPVAWNLKAEQDGVRLRVFCASTADWADEEAPAGQRERLFQLIKKTPHLDWLLLTKRAENIEKYLPADWGETGYPNVWLGVTVENKKEGLPRIDILRKIPAVCRFLSCEPLIEDLGNVNLNGIHWVIIGGETGRGPSKKEVKNSGKKLNGIRSMDLRWVDSLVKQCQEQGVAPWVKQLGKLPLDLQGEPLVITYETKDGKMKRSPNGENWDQWPSSIAHLKVREIPDFSQAERDKMESSLSDLAKGLDKENAEKELQLRTQLLETDKILFTKRKYRAEIIKQYHDIYHPLRKWDAFCRAADIPKRTSYDLLKAARENHAESAQKEPKKKDVITPQKAAEKAKASINRLLKGLKGAERNEALKLILGEFDAELNKPTETEHAPSENTRAEQGKLITITPAA